MASAETLLTAAGTIVAAGIGARAVIRAAYISKEQEHPKSAFVIALRMLLRRRVALLAFLVGVSLLSAYLMAARSMTQVVRASETSYGQYAELMSILRPFIKERLEESHHLRLSKRSSEGSTETTEQICNGEADLGLIQANSAPTSDDLTAIAAVYDEYFFLLARPDLECSDVFELRNCVGGRDFKVSTLRPKSQTYRDMVRVFDALGFEPGQYQVEHNGGYREALDDVVEGRSDVAFFITGLGNEDVMRAISSGACRLVSFERNTALAMRLPGTVSVAIPAGFFGAAQPDDYETLTTRALLVCSRRLGSAFVFELTKSLFEGRALLAQKFPNLNIRRILEVERTLFPVHPGAMRYYEKQMPSFVERHQFWIIAAFGAISACVLVVGLSLSDARLASGARGAVGDAPCRALLNELRRGENRLQEVTP